MPRVLVVAQVEDGAKWEGQLSDTRKPFQDVRAEGAGRVRGVWQYRRSLRRSGERTSVSAVTAGSGDRGRDEG